MIEGDRELERCRVEIDPGDVEARRLADLGSEAAGEETLVAFAVAGSAADPPGASSWGRIATGARMTLLERYDAILDRIVEEAVRLYGPRLVSCAVFGSVGRRTPRHDSDIDLLIVARDLPRGRFARVEEFLALESRLESDLRPETGGNTPIELSPVFKTPEEAEAGSPLFLDMVEDARIVFDPEGFLERRLDRLRARLAALGARRIWSGNAWYWELKPDLRPGEVFAL